MDKKTRLMKKADKLLQELGRIVYDTCLSCKKQSSVLHHYIPKSRSSFLRYNLKNCIPLCNGCHFAHHNGDPKIHNRINEALGKEWYQELEAQQRQAIKKGFKFNIAYLENTIEVLEALKEKSKKH